MSGGNGAQGRQDQIEVDSTMDTRDPNAQISPEPMRPPIHPYITPSASGPRNRGRSVSVTDSRLGTHLIRRLHGAGLKRKHNEQGEAEDEEDEEEILAATIRRSQAEIINGVDIDEETAFERARQASLAPPDRSSMGPSEFWDEFLNGNGAEGVENSIEGNENE